TQLFLEAQHHAAQLQVEIEEREHAAANIRRLNRVHGVLSGINSLIVRVADRTELFWGACRLAVEQGQYRAAWCSWLDAQTSRITPVAWAGDAADIAQMLICKLREGAEED